MSKEQIALFDDSLERCTANPGFLDRFYDTFMASSKEVAEAFKHTSFHNQKILVKTSFMLGSLKEQCPTSEHEYRSATTRSHSRS
jgi:hypothetical protein